MRPSSAWLAAVCIAIPAIAVAGETRWVHGSWVNVRSAPSATGSIITRVTANTKVSVLADQGEWCEIAYGTPEVRGFIACNLLGRDPLSLAEVGKGPQDGGKPGPHYSPTRAFWIAPSVSRLEAAGRFFWSTMLSESQRKKENPSMYSPGGDDRKFDWDQRPKPVRFPIPEFEAMKALMRDGVVAAEELRPATLRWAEVLNGSPGDNRDSVVVNGWWFSANTLRVLKQGRLSAVKPSFFRDARDLAPPSTSVEGLSSHFGIRERVRVLSGPEWVWPRNEEPFVAGAWDIGSLEIALDKPVIEYVIGRTGLAAAMEWTPTLKQNLNGDDGGCVSGFGQTQHGKRRLPGYPHVKDPLVWVQLPAAPKFRKVAVKSSARRLDPSAENRSDTMSQASYSLLVMHEIDIDGDGIPDLAAWEGMIGRPEGDASESVVLRAFFANVAGEWRLLETDSYGECT